MKYFLITLIIYVLLLAGCSSGVTGVDIEVNDSWVRAVSIMKTENTDESEIGSQVHLGDMSANSAAYMVLVNNGNQADKLIGIASDVANTVELHESKIENDVMKMQQVEFIEVPANGQVELKPGGLHIMLIGLTKDLNEGDKVRLDLEFEVSGELPIEAEVRMP